MLEHGGKLRQAVQQYGIPLENWLDLSTGINPNGWPLPPLDPSLWVRLPEENDGLEQAARDYYSAQHILPVAGSQAAIQALPRLRSQSRVSVLAPGYAEHAAAWRRAGHAVTACGAQQIDEAIVDSDVVVLINPNNPTGIRFTQDQLLAWHQQLAARGGWLVIDEAFMDITPQKSLSAYSTKQGLIILRSLGKFFGLAGARVGFVCAHPDLLLQLQNLLGPWCISAPARQVATAALNDRHWQAQARQQLEAASSRLHDLLTRHKLPPSGGCALFQWVCTADASDLHESLARQGILTRLFDEPSSLRFALPDSESGWLRLSDALP
jgi:cobalamin biosynthesis protein CobC